MTCRMLDGDSVTTPKSAAFIPDGVRGVENHGVDPDSEGEDEPADLLAGPTPSWRRAWRRRWRRWRSRFPRT